MAAIEILPNCEVEVPLNPGADGRYQAQGGELGVAGRWQAVIIVRRQGLEDARICEPTAADDRECESRRGEDLELHGFHLYDAVTVTVPCMFCGWNEQSYL